MAEKAKRLSVELPEELGEAVVRIADARQQSSAKFVEEAVRAYIEDDGSYLAAIDEALAEADKGEFVSSEKFEAWVKSLGTDHELPMPEPDVFLHTAS